jgi:hypothetical protein
MIDLTNLKVGDTVHLRCGGSIVVKDYVEECRMGSCYVNGIGYLPNGEHDTAHSEFDIISITPKPEPKRIKGWVNLWRDGHNIRIGYLWDTKEQALGAGVEASIACIYIDVAEGEGI